MTLRDLAWGEAWHTVYGTDRRTDMPRTLDNFPALAAFLLIGVALATIVIAWFN